MKRPRSNSISRRIKRLEMRGHQLEEEHRNMMRAMGILEEACVELADKKTQCAFEAERLRKRTKTRIDLPIGVNRGRLVFAVQKEEACV